MSRRQPACWQAAGERAGAGAGGARRPAGQRESRVVVLEPDRRGLPGRDRLRHAAEGAVPAGRPPAAGLVSVPGRRLRGRDLRDPDVLLGVQETVAAAGLSEEEFSAVPRPEDQPRRRMVQPCRVPGCRRPWIDAPRALCSAHHWQKDRVHRCSLEEFLARTDLEPLPGLGACAVAACYRDASVIKSMLCHAHNCRSCSTPAGPIPAWTPITGWQPRPRSPREPR